MSLDNIVTFSDNTGPRNYRKEAKEVWVQLDQDNSETVDVGEIKSWLMHNDVLCDFTQDDASHTIQKLFDEIDSDGNGSLDFEEFCKFYKMVQHEKAQMLHASRHHIVALPASVVKFNKKAFTTEAIELLLQDKIQQFTSQDSDRFRQILTMFKTQTQRSHSQDRDGEDQVMGVTSREFQTVLMWLGLFATKQQAHELFLKYDMNKDGILTVHEFLTRARPTDYPGRTVNNGEKYSFRTGKRMFLGDTLNGRPVRPTTPCDDVYHISEDVIADRVRQRMGNKPGVGQHYNETPNAMRDLLIIFQFYDPNKTGTCSMDALKRALQNLNIALGESHVELLMDKFGTMDLGQPKFLYEKFVQHVYPGKPKNAALPIHTSLQIRKNLYGKFKSNTMDFSRVTGGVNTKSMTGRMSGRQSARSQSSQGRSQAARTQMGTQSRAQSRGGVSNMSGRMSGRQPRTGQRLTPLRGLTPSASLTQLRSGPKSLPRSMPGSARSSLSRTASQPQFLARAKVPV